VKEDAMTTPISREDALTTSEEEEQADHHVIPSSRNDQVLTRLETFRVIRNKHLDWLFPKLALVLILFLVADWLIGPRIIAGDIFRLINAVGIIVVLLLTYNVFIKVPETLETIWTRGLIGRPDNHSSTKMRFLNFIEEFDSALNHRMQALIGVILAGAAAFLTYPAVYWINKGSSPFPIMDYFRLSTGGMYLLEILMGFFLGLIVWRVGVIVFYVNQLTRHFQLKIQPKHPDRGGGLKPLAELCFNNALVVLTPVIVLSIWVIMAGKPGFEVLELWKDIYTAPLLILSVATVFVFFQPLYRLHRQMVEQRHKIQAELDQLVAKVEDLLSELRVQGDSLAPGEGNKRIEHTEFLNRVCKASGKIPTWPLDWGIIFRISGAHLVQIVTILSMIAAGDPLLKIISRLTALITGQ
jgi:hypothetical protein